ncbi:MAG: ACP S-malonyltransferase [Candidatus Omnitrophota bacterium]|nr:MAG: ACP S-malonyltransferase [Candidatus Omnitrophota bacterium]
MKAIVFPGQGAQYVGMGKSLYESFDEARSIFSQIDAIVGFPLSEKCFLGPKEDLTDTSIQQLAILATSVAAFEVFKQRNIPVAYLSGLSLGEYTCLYAAEVLPLKDLVFLVKERAAGMQLASELNPSTMLAVIGIKKPRLEELGSRYNFYLANFNAPGQVVISLKRDAKSTIKKILESEGARVVELAVSGGFHSPFMEQAKQRLTMAIDRVELRTAKIPIVSNYTGLPAHRKEELRKNLLEQLTSAVLWKDCVEHIISGGVDTFFEIGPSKVLRGLMRKIAPQVRVINCEKSQDFDQMKLCVH